MNCASARSSRASAPFSTTKRAPESASGAREIHQSELFADRLVRQRREIEARRVADPAQLAIGGFVRAVRHFGRRQVG